MSENIFFVGLLDEFLPMFVYASSSNDFSNNLFHAIILFSFKVQLILSAILVFAAS